ncbi:MAG: tetratricopeptide repeat protein, partial [Acidobacteriota bacterium]|nr:tetratricopeptide repeat protein [Acidobacteriota bacterium]
SRASAIKVGQAVGATAIVTGQLTLDDDQLLVSTRVVRLDAGRLSSETTSRGAPGELLDVVARVASGLAGMARRSSGWRPPPSLSAFELFTRGLVADAPAARQAYFEQALDAAPGYDAVRLALWELHTAQGAHEAALASVAGVPKESPLYRDACYAAAMSQVERQRFDEAFDLLLELQRDGPLAGASNALGVVQVRRGASPQTGRATYYFNQATEIEPAEADYFFNLGYAYWLEQDANGAAYWLREAVRRNVADGDAHFVLSAALQRMGATAESQRERELARRLSSQYAAWEARAAAGGEVVPRGLERLHDRLDRSAIRVDAFIASSGQRDQAELAAFHLDAARRAYDREADREAEGELTRALYLSPYLADAHVLLGRVHLRSGRADLAVQTLKIAIWSEETVEAQLLLAEACLATGDVGSARSAVDRALVLEPRSAEAAALKARLPRSR